MYLIFKYSLKKKLESQNVKIEELSQQMKSLKEKNESIMNYANDRLRQLMGNQKIIEINEKVYRDLRNFLEEK